MELKKIVRCTKAQFDTLAAGGTVGTETGYDPEKLYLVEQCPWDDAATLIFEGTSNNTSVNQVTGSVAGIYDYDLIIIDVDLGNDVHVPIMFVPKMLNSLNATSNNYRITFPLTEDNYLTVFIVNPYNTNPTLDLRSNVSYSAKVYGVTF